MNLVHAIRAAVGAGRYIVGIHARQRLRGRKVALWQVEVGLGTGTVVQVRPASKPNPSILVEQTLADGTTIFAVWSWLAATSRAKLVTVFFPRRGKP